MRQTLDLQRTCRPVDITGCLLDGPADSTKSRFSNWPLSRRHGSSQIRCGVRSPRCARRVYSVTRTCGRRFYVVAASRGSSSFPPREKFPDQHVVWSKPALALSLRTACLLGTKRRRCQQSICYIHFHEKHVRTVSHGELCGFHQALCGDGPNLHTRSRRVLRKKKRFHPRFLGQCLAGRQQSDAATKELVRVSFEKTAPPG